MDIIDVKIAIERFKTKRQCLAKRGRSKQGHSNWKYLYYKNIIDDYKGFRRGMSTLDQIFILKQVLKEH